MRSFQRSALEKAMHLDDQNVTASPFDPHGRDALDVAEEMLQRERSLGLAPGWQAEHLPKVLPAGWHPIEQDECSQKWRSIDGMIVIISASVEQDNKRWLHVSCSRPKRLPTWEDLKLVKHLFIGRDKDAIQLLPAAARYVNQHPFCLHLYCCLDGGEIPDFTHGIGRI